MLRSLGALLVVAAMLALTGCQGRPATTARSQSGEMEAAAAEGSSIRGKTAPDFTLVNQNDQPVKLSSLRGKWVVLYFYPKDDTPGCVCQATEFTRVLRDFHSMNAEILGVSTDSPQSHRSFIQKYDLKLTLLSDPDHRVIKQYGAWAESTMNSGQYGHVVRTTLLIDPQGVIRYNWPEVIPQGHAQRVKEKLAELQAK